MLLSGSLPMFYTHAIQLLLIEIDIFLPVIAQLCIWDYSGQITFFMSDKTQIPVDCQRQSDQEVCSIMSCLKLVCLCLYVFIFYIHSFRLYFDHKLFHFPSVRDEHMYFMCHSYLAYFKDYGFCILRLLDTLMAILRFRLVLHKGCQNGFKPVS